MTYSYVRTIYFRETDGAGVVYFANVLALCHEAYEASLVASGISLSDFFTDPLWAVPIVHGEVDFLKPLRCGDRITITVSAVAISSQEFLTHYDIYLAQNVLAGKGQLKHCCIDRQTRRRQNISSALQNWLEKMSPTTIGETSAQE